jgi:hypothetical protein
MIVRYGYECLRPEMLALATSAPLTWKQKIWRSMYKARQFAIYALLAGVQVLNVFIFLHFY